MMISVTFECKYAFELTKAGSEFFFSKSVEIIMFSRLKSKYVGNFENMYQIFKITFSY